MHTDRQTDRQTLSLKLLNKGKFALQEGHREPHSKRTPGILLPKKLLVGVEGRLWGRLGDVVTSRTIGDTRDIFTRVSSCYKITFEFLQVLLNWLYMFGLKLWYFAFPDSSVAVWPKIPFPLPFSGYFCPVSLKVFKMYLLLIYIFHYKILNTLWVP
jgi:hypothetical protein